MWRVILAVVLLGLDTLMGVISFKGKEYKWACANFFMAGWFLCCVLWHIEAL